MRRVAFLALMAFAVALSGCRAYNSANPYPSDRPASTSGGSGFPITKSFINNSVERDSPNL